MAYTPTTWVTGDTVTATKMNKIENGIANAGNNYDIVISADQYPASSSTNFTVLSGSSTACYNKLQDGDPLVRALLIFDITWGTFPFSLVLNSTRIQCVSISGNVGIYFPDLYGGGGIALYAAADGTVGLD